MSVGPVDNLKGAPFLNAFDAGLEVDRKTTNLAEGLLPDPKEGGDLGEGKPELPGASLNQVDLRKLALGMGASFGGEALAILQETLAKMRLDADKQRIAEQQSIADKMESQADEMRSNAAKAFACAMVSAGISMAASIYSTWSSASNLKMNSPAADASDADKMMSARLLEVKNQRTQGIAGIINSSAQVVSATKDYVAGIGEAQIKEMEADIEKKRAFVESLKSIGESLSEVISKAVSAQQAIQESMNQTRTKILT